ncbi:ArdC family protein [Neolewinella xylanilytica]|uniref:ArdC family protein n=1 Tax=Neolewinella xylanilytica TaxID=1514080 RepID=UPI0021D31410|nr:zincin-like metallopeptidase domain-containing protein [Neolewinella xylanilytica]
MLRVYRVFNVSQIDGLDPSFYEVEVGKPLEDFEKDDRAEALIQATGARIREVPGDRAFYSPTDDGIQMPLRGQFQGVAEAWYAVVLHEVGHWTGAPHRLDRNLKGAFGSAAYAEEELVAELTSAMVCARLGFSKMTTNNAAYIKSWLGALKSDTKFVFKAAAQAQRAADYILDKSGYRIEPEEPSPS